MSRLTLRLAEVRKQQEAFKNLLDRLGLSSSDHLMSSLSRREEVDLEADLSPEAIALIKKRIRNAVDP